VFQNIANSKLNKNITNVFSFHKTHKPRNNKFLQFHSKLC